jgi:hypothetical protein
MIIMTKPSTAKVKSLKIPLVGKKVPKQYHGNVGRFIEKGLAKNGHNVNTGKGIDLPEENLEVKSRKTESTSAHTIGSITREHIKTTPWHDTDLKAKCQRQYRVSYSDNESVIKEAKIYDLTDPYIQEKFEEGYEAGRKLIIEGNEGDYIRGSKWGYFEKQTDNSYQYRIPHSSMKTILTAAGNNFGDLFE